MGIVLWIIFGGLVGWIASLLVGAPQGGIIVYIILGILGSVVGGWIMSAINKTGVTGFNLYSFFVALLGAVVLVWIAGLLFQF